MASVLYFGFLGHEPCGILALQPELNLTPSALEGEVLITGPRGNPSQYFKISLNTNETFQLHS